MAGNQELFEQYMQAGDGAAWDNDWEAAIQQYMQALREFPTSPAACNSLGYALFQVGRLDDALKSYGQAHRLDPDDPLPVEKSADVLERMGRTQDAAKQHLVVAEIYLGQHDLEKAISNWKRATEITPGLVKIHQKLAMAYERLGQRGDAINEYMKLAYQFQKAGKANVSNQALQRALRLDAKNPRILNAMTALRANRPISPDLLEDKSSDNDGASAQDVATAELEALLDVADASAIGPMGDAVEMSLEQLAVAVFESGMMDASGADAIQAIEMHRAGIADEALGAYQRAEAGGMQSPALMLNLGVLLVESNQHQEALPRLQKVTGNLTLEAGARHALSLIYVESGQWREAANSLLDTLRLAEVSLVMDETEADELNQLYGKLKALVGQSDEQTLENFGKSLSQMLTGVDWKRRVVQTRSRLEDLLSKDSGHALEDIAKGETVIDAMGLIDNYVSQRRYTIAMDEAFHIIEKEPDYLAAHLRIAQILMETNMIENAINKYNWIARTYLIRGDQHKAADILNEVIQVAPSDINLRVNLIELLETQERWDDVLQQYIDLASAYRDLADLGGARSTYDQALKLAQQREMSISKQIEIMHHLAGIDMQRVEIRAAMRNYQKIVEIDKNDVKAHRELVDIYYRLNNPTQAVSELDQLLQIYARQKRPDLILEVLEEQSGKYPQDMGLKNRLGIVYQQMNRPQDAISQFEELRQLQYDAGLHDEAKQTIKRIISMNPPRVEQYQQLLQQMGG